MQVAVGDVVVHGVVEQHRVLTHRHIHTKQYNIHKDEVIAWGKKSGEESQKPGEGALQVRGTRHALYIRSTYNQATSRQTSSHASLAGVDIHFLLCDSLPKKPMVPIKRSPSELLVVEKTRLANMHMIM